MSQTSLVVAWHPSTPLCSGIGMTPDDYIPADDGANRTFGPCLPGQASLAGNQLNLTNLEPGQAVKLQVGTCTPLRMRC